MAEIGDASREGVETLPGRVSPEDLCEVFPDLPHPVATHCRSCHASWTRASKTAHCMTCHRTFSSPHAFDTHLQPVGCKDPATIVARKTGVPKFGAPTANKWGTPVWHTAGLTPHPRAQVTP